MRALLEHLDTVDSARVQCGLADLRSAWQPYRTGEPVVGYVDSLLAQH
ncbi:hypothetical protein [Streptodolium elevatio]|uniref:Uncharacterized protein n=1 Tax=Streptodolium elevatio TaxID=3157996 RepID=A0ABV3DW29_9ACTN